MQRPVRDGYEATRRRGALEDPQAASIPIVAMTANAFDEDKRSALKCGMNGFISKPIVIDDVIEALSEVFKG